MLALTRKKNQSIMIGDDIEIAIVEIGNGNVRIAIKAPQDIPILRKEIYDAIVKENKAASQLAADALEGLPEL
jgi:carbon storage regulator